MPGWFGSSWFETVAEAQRRAQRRLPPSVYKALLAGSERGTSYEDNLTAFGELGLSPHVAGNSAARDLATTVMGQDVSMPVLISPTGVQAVHPEGEVAVARAAAARGTAMGLSSFASRSVEDVMVANPVTFFQMYWMGSRESMERRMARARDAGVVGLIATLDWSFSHGRDWGSPHIPDKVDLKAMIEFAPEVLRRPRWLTEYARTGRIPDLTTPNLTDGDGPAPTFFGAYGEWMQTPPPSWEDVAWMRETWGGPFLLKGVGRIDDARRAVDAGVTAISVSNHGGNNIDGTPAPIRMLPGIAGAVGDQVEVLMDGGDPTRQRRRQGGGARGAGGPHRSGVPLGARRQRAGRGRERPRRAPRRDRLRPARAREVLHPRADAGRRHRAAGLHPRPRGRRTGAVGHARLTAEDRTP